jgi:predicted TIM-barrel fold metal-dependent hydrolase
MLVPIAHSDPERAADIVRRVADEPGVVGACFVSDGGRTPFGNRRYDPIYAACEDNDLPVVFHAGGVTLDDYNLRGFESILETHSLGFLISNMSQITSIVVQGVPEKFPDLDFVFEEAGLFYVPMMMYRLDQEYLRQYNEAPLLEKRPSEYMKEFYYGTQPMEVPPDPKYFEWLFEMMGGVDRLLFATDWPHGDHDEVNAITDLSFLSTEEKDKILGGNAAKVFDL